MVANDISDVTVRFSVLYPNLTRYGYTKETLMRVFSEQNVNRMKMIRYERAMNAKVINILQTKWFPKLNSLVSNCSNNKIKTICNQLNNEWFDIMTRHNEIYVFIFIDCELVEDLRCKALNICDMIKKYMLYVAISDIANKDEVKNILWKVGLMIYRYLISMHNIGNTELNFEGTYTDDVLQKLKMDTKVVFHKFSDWLNYYDERARYIYERISTNDNDNVIALEDEPDYDNGTFHIDNYLTIATEFRQRCRTIAGTQIEMDMNEYREYCSMVRA